MGVDFENLYGRNTIGYTGTTPRGRSEPSKGELLGSELPFYGIEVALPLKLAVDPNSQEPGLLNRLYSLVIEVDRRYRRSAGTGKIKEFAFFRGKFHSSSP